MKAIDDLAENVNTPEVSTYIIELTNAILERLSKGDQKDLKEVDGISIQRFLSFMNKIFKRYKAVEGKDIITEIEAAIITANLRNDDFVNKSNAIDSIKNKYALTTIRIKLY